MKNKERIFILFGIILTAIMIMFISLYFQKDEKNVTILTEKDSYASTYFNKKQVEIVPDSEKEKYTLIDNNKINFEYNIKEDKVEIVKYTGIDKKVIIPERIDGYTVTTITFNETFNKIEEIYIPKTVQEIKGTEITAKILVEKGTYAEAYFNENKVEENQIEILADSEKDKYISKYKYINFGYNIEGDKVEIVKYTGTNKKVIIPEKIDGYIVTGIKLDDTFKEVEEIYIPGTVEKIEGNINSDKDVEIWIIIALSIVALVLYTVILATMPNKNLDDNFNNSSTYTISILYIIATLVFGILLRSGIFATKTYYISFTVVTAIYVILTVALKMYKKKIIEFDNEVKNRN